MKVSGRLGQPVSTYYLLDWEDGEARLYMLPHPFYILPKLAVTPYIESIRFSLMSQVLRAKKYMPSWYWHVTAYGATRIRIHTTVSTVHNPF